MSRFCWLGLAASLALSGCGLRSSSIRQPTATVEKSAVAVVLPTKLAIRKVEDPGSKQTTFEVFGLISAVLAALKSQSLDRNGWQEIFPVYAGAQGQGSKDVPPMQGNYRVTDDRIIFQPQFPLQPGMTYRAELRTQKLPSGSQQQGGVLVEMFQIKDSPKVPKSVVEHIYPTSSKLPENLLKFYLHFSHPMSRGAIYEHIHLLDASGKPVELPFLEIDEELWDPSLKRLTLFIDPGRIKRGVRPLEEIGPALQTGKRYTLVIDREWKDGDGAPLKASFRKTFTVNPPDRDPPNPARWIIQAPAAGTRHPLLIQFAEPMDHALAQRLIWIVDSQRQRLDGETELSDAERKWTFTPTAPWKPGRYQIIAGSVVEDLAGNSLEKPFEVDVFDRVQRPSAPKEITLPFDVK